MFVTFVLINQSHKVLLEATVYNREFTVHGYYNTVHNEVIPSDVRYTTLSAFNACNKRMHNL